MDPGGISLWSVYLMVRPYCPVINTILQKPIVQDLTIAIISRNQHYVHVSQSVPHLMPLVFLGVSLIHFLATQRYLLA